MANQQFYADPNNTFTWENGAIGYRPGGPFDCIGPFAKVKNCPIDGTDLRLTCYATGHHDTFFSIPACTKHRDKYIGGYMTTDGDGVKFVPYDRYRDRLAPRPTPAARLVAAWAAA
jgi:hypothetical protein